MSDRERFKVDVLRKALKTQRSESLNRENDLQNHLSGLWKVRSTLNSHGP